jgi:hypothetical protein
MALAIYSFAGANSITVGELGVSLDNCKVKISLLKEQLKLQMDQMEMDFMQNIKEKEYLYII